MSLRGILSVSEGLCRSNLMGGLRRLPRFAHNALGNISEVARLWHTSQEIEQKVLEARKKTGYGRRGEL